MRKPHSPPRKPGPPPLSGPCLANPRTLVGGVSPERRRGTTRLRYRTRPMFRSDLEHSLYSRMWIWRGSDASASAVLGRPEFEEGKGRSGLLCQVLYSRTLDLERVRRGRLAVGRPEFEEGKGRSGLLVSSAGAVEARNWIPMLKGGL